MRRLFLGLVMSVLTVSTAQAVVIDFEDRTGPSTFPSSAETVSYTNVGGSGIDVTFDFGALLDETTNLPANQTTVYGSVQSPNYQNPMRVTFSTNISNFFLDVLNGETTDVGYMVSDNLGNSGTFTLVPNTSSGATTIGFAAAGNIVFITSLSDVGATETGFWDFFVDNVHFNEPLPNPVPEPGTLGLLLAGLAALGIRKRRLRQ